MPMPRVARGTTPERPRRIVQQAREGAHEHEGGEQRRRVVEAAADVGGGEADEFELVQRPLEQAAQQRQDLPQAPLQVRQMVIRYLLQPIAGTLACQARTPSTSQKTPCQRPWI